MIFVFENIGVIAYSKKDALEKLFDQLDWKQKIQFNYHYYIGQWGTGSCMLCKDGSTGNIDRSMEWNHFERRHTKERWIDHHCKLETYFKH